MLEIGQVVRSVAGHDKHRYYVVVEVLGEGVTIADGKLRKLEQPKRKNLKHLHVTHSKVNLEEVTSNRALHRKLEPMNHALLNRKELT